MISPTDDLEGQIALEAKLLAATLSKIGNNHDFRAVIARIGVRKAIMAICTEFSDSDEALMAIDEELDALGGWGGVTQHFRDRDNSA